MTDPKQKPSAVIARQTGRGFPAEFVSSITSDARADNKTIERLRHREPRGGTSRRVPPDVNRGNSPTITGLVDKHIQLKHPNYRTIRFFLLHYNDNQGVTAASLPGEVRQA